MVRHSVCVNFQAVQFFRLFRNKEKPENVGSHEGAKLKNKKYILMSYYFY